MKYFKCILAGLVAMIVICGVIPALATVVQNGIRGRTNEEIESFMYSSAHHKRQDDAHGKWEPAP